MSDSTRHVPNGAERLLAQYGLPLALLACLAAAPLLPGAGPVLLGLAAALATGITVRRLLDRNRAACGERTLLSEQLVQSQKLAVLGELSSGIAHEINTPLAIIDQEVELLELDCGEDVPAQTRERLEKRFRSIRSQVHRCADITHGMLQMVRKAAPVRQPAALPELCEDMALLAEREAMRREVRILRDYEKGLPEVDTDPPQLKQVVLNLLVNAVQALGPGGTVRLGVRRESAASVLIEVRDDGPGIPEQNLDKIFNPFFTTKPPGQGTGLGLSVCLGIVDRLGGTLGAANGPKGGAVFTVRLPVQTTNSGPGPGKEREEAS